jgi:hypothetical protein
MNEYERRYKDDEDEGGWLGNAALLGAGALMTPLGRPIRNSAMFRLNKLPL